MPPASTLRAGDFVVSYNPYESLAWAAHSSPIASVVISPAARKALPWPT